MIHEARRRLAARPDFYFPKIYGLDEAGGTSVLYLSALPFSELGFKKVTDPRPSPNTPGRRFGSCRGSFCPWARF